MKPIPRYTIDEDDDSNEEESKENIPSQPITILNYENNSAT